MIFGVGGMRGYANCWHTRFLREIKVKSKKTAEARRAAIKAAWLRAGSKRRVLYGRC